MLQLLSDSDMIYTGSHVSVQVAAVTPGRCDADEVTCKQKEAHSLRRANMHTGSQDNDIPRHVQL